MNRSYLQEALAPLTIVRRFYLYDSLDSTMEQARRLLNSAARPADHHATLIAAAHQTHGRGRHGRHWQSHPGQSVLATLILIPSALQPAPAPPLDLPLLACAVPVALCQALQSWVPNARIKYPNDIVADNRKLAGILIESHQGALLVGFGINCQQELAGLPPDARIPASSLFLETGQHIAPEQVLASVLTQLQQVLQPERRAEIIPSMNHLCSTIGSDIHLETETGLITGQVQKIDDHGRLVLLTPDGPRLLYSTQIIRTWKHAEHHPHS